MKRHCFLSSCGLIALLFALLSACAITSAQDVPALVDRLDANGKADLQAAASRTLGVGSVLLADDAFTRDSSVVVEPAALRDLGGRVQGRETRMPERLNLVLRGATCVLIHEGSGREATLSKVRCKPKPKS